MRGVIYWKRVNQKRKIETTEGNRACEGYSRTYHGMLITLEDEKRNRPTLWVSLTAIYNSTPHLVNGLLPHYLVFGV